MRAAAEESQRKEAAAKAVLEAARAVSREGRALSAEERASAERPILNLEEAKADSAPQKVLISGGTSAICTSKSGPEWYQTSACYP